MFARSGIRLATTAGVALAAVAASGTPALAADTSFSVSHYHASGALATKITGNLVWHNRAVTVTNIRIYTRAGECAFGEFFGFNNGYEQPHDDKTTAVRCSSVDMWHDNISDIPVGDPSSAQRRTDWIGIVAHDQTHGGYSFDVASR